MSAVRKDDVGHRGEGMEQIGIYSGLDGSVSLSLDTNTNHGNYDSSEDTDKGWQQSASPFTFQDDWQHTQAGNVGHVLHGTGKRADHANDKPYSSEHHRAGAVLCNGVHHDAECQDVATHDEDGEQKLANAKELTTECTHQDLASIGEVLDVRIAVVELRNDQPGIGGKQAQADNQDDGPVGWPVNLHTGIFSRSTYGARPSWARVAGNDSTPRETDSAIMTR